MRKLLLVTAIAVVFAASFFYMRKWVNEPDIPAATVQYVPAQTDTPVQTDTPAQSSAPAEYFTQPPTAKPQEIIPQSRYEVYTDNAFVKGFEDVEAAIEYASEFENSGVKERNRPKWIWDNFPPYNVFVNKETVYTEFESFAEAADFAREYGRAFIYYRKDNRLIWTNVGTRKSQGIVEAPLVLQMPELPTGCEVTSLTMLLNQRGVEVDKMTLAEQIEKDPTPYSVIKGQVHFGNPNVGFVGRMDGSGTGYGVYHGPLYRLLLEYIPYSAHDLTGCEFDDLLYFLAAGSPVVVIVNATYAPLPEKSFVTWQTPQGEITITWREHSVLVTGYDEEYIYFNDPLGLTDRAKRQSFMEAWEQMGRQAVSVSP